MKKDENPLTCQVGGDHYRSMKVQPIEVIQDFNLSFAEGSALKYVSRWRKKGGFQDLEKAVQCLRFEIHKHESNRNLDKLVEFVTQFNELEMIILTLICSHKTKAAIEAITALIQAELNKRMEPHD